MLYNQQLQTPVLEDRLNMVDYNKLRDAEKVYVLLSNHAFSDRGTFSKKLFERTMDGTFFRKINFKEGNSNCYLLIPSGSLPVFDVNYVPEEYRGTRTCYETFLELFGSKSSDCCLFAPTFIEENISNNGNYELVVDLKNVVIWTPWDLGYLSELNSLRRHSKK